MKQSPKGRPSPAEPKHSGTERDASTSSGSARPASITLPTSPLAAYCCDKFSNEESIAVDLVDGSSTLQQLPLRLEESEMQFVMNVLQKYRIRSSLKGSAARNCDGSVLSIMEYIQEQVDRSESRQQELRLANIRLKELESKITALERTCLGSDGIKDSDSSGAIHLQSLHTSVASPEANAVVPVSPVENRYSKQYVANLEYKYLKLQGKLDHAEMTIGENKVSLQKAEEEIQRVDKENEVLHGLKEAAEGRVTELEEKVFELQNMLKIVEQEQKQYQQQMGLHKESCSSTTEDCCGLSKTKLKSKNNRNGKNIVSTATAVSTSSTSKPFDFLTTTLLCRDSIVTAVAAFLVGGAVYLLYNKCTFDL